MSKVHKDNELNTIVLGEGYHVFSGQSGVYENLTIKDNYSQQSLAQVCVVCLGRNDL